MRLSHQPFGCMIAIDNTTFRVIAFSENARERPGLAPQSVPSVDKPEILTIGTDTKTFFTPSSASQKLVVQAISNLQALPGGDIKLLCDTVVQIVRELTGYDPVEDGGG
ncbi:Phytochrome B1 [Helianthus anomalus]